MEELLEISELMYNGNCTDAIAKFKKLNCTPREFQDFLDDIGSVQDFLDDIGSVDINLETLKNFAILGFYARGEADV